jgi:hypothetical protein
MANRESNLGPIKNCQKVLIVEGWVHQSLIRIGLWMSSQASEPSAPVTEWSEFSAEHLTALPPNRYPEHRHRLL